MAVGDSLGSQRDDNQLLDRALSAAKSKGAQQFILVTPLGGGGGLGGLFGSLFGGGGGSSKQPSKIERQVHCIPVIFTPTNPVSQADADFKYETCFTILCFTILCEVI